MTSVTRTLASGNPYKRFVTASSTTKAISDQLVLAGVIAAVGIGFGLVQGPVYAPLADTIGQMFEDMPDGILAMIGGADMSTPEGWFEGEMYSILAPLAIVSLAAWSVAKAFAGEVQDKSMGLVLAAPLTRARIGGDKVVAMLVHILIGSLGFFLGTWLGVFVAGLDVSTSGIVAVNIHLALLGACFGGIAMLVAVVTQRKVVAVLVAIGLAVFSYLWAGYVPLIDAIEGLAVLSPWYHYNGSSPLSNGLDWGNLVVLVLITAGLLVASLAIFDRRDIPA